MPSTMYPSSGDLYIYQGADFAAIVTVENEDGTPADIAGWTARSQIRRNVADLDPEIAAELTCLVEAPNFVKLSLLKDATLELCGRYVWDLDLYSPTGASWPVMSGKVLGTQEVTRDTVMAAAGTKR